MPGVMMVVMAVRRRLPLYWWVENPDVAQSVAVQALGLDVTETAPGGGP